MVYKKLKILFFCMIFVSGPAPAQQKPVSNNNCLLLSQYKTPWQSFSLNKSLAVPNAQKIFLPADFYAAQLGFFCRQEIKLDKVTKIPFRFRLGSVEQCDWLEGKRK
jgi:hypothetical protein